MTLFFSKTMSYYNFAGILWVYTRFFSDVLPYGMGGHGKIID